MVSSFKDLIDTISTSTPLEIHQWAWIFAGIFTLAAVGVSFTIIGLHLKHWKDPALQKSMCRIVLMVPVYVIGSYLSLLWKDEAFYFTLIRDCYEAYVLYMFFKMLIELADGEEALISKLEYLDQFRCFAPLCCCHIKPGRIFLHRCKQMILQFVILKPILAVFTFCLSFYGIYDEGSFDYDRGYLYVTIVYNVSFTIALYFLVLFYESIKHILAKYRPLAKFLCIKAVVFFSYWQSIIIAIMVYFGWVIESKDDWTISDVATGLQNFLICVEMLPLAIAHIKSFGHKSYVEEGADIVNLSDLEGSTWTIWQRLGYIANIGDVFKDTFEALKKGPRRNVHAGGFLELSKEEKLRCVVKQGWLYKRGEDLAKIWKLRYCLLISKPKGLIYFKRNIFEQDLSPDPKPIKARGFVDFVDLIGVSPHRKSLERFAIATKPRKWHFKTKTAKERDEWMMAIETLHGGITIGADTVLMDVPLDDIPSNNNDDVQQQLVAV